MYKILRCLLFTYLLLSLLCVSSTYAQNPVSVHAVDGEYILEWLVLGPFFPGNLEKDFLADVGGEANVHPQEGDTVTTEEGKILTWKRYTAKDNLVNLVDAVGNEENATAYAFCLLQSEEARSVKIGLGSDDGVAVFFNGKEVHSHPVNRVFTRDEDGFEVQIQAGINRCLVKVYNGSSAWAFAMRVLPSITSLMDQLTDENKDVRDSAVRALGHIGEPAVQPLIEAWSSDNMLLNIAQALTQIGEPAIPALEEALNESKEYIRPLAAGALGQIDDARRDEMIRLLIEALAHRHALVRNHAAWALSQMGEPAKAAAPALINALTDEDDMVRLHAALGLGQMGKAPQTAVPVLIYALTDEDHWVRLHAAETLGKMGEPAKAAVPALTNALTDEYTEVRRNATMALRQIGKSAEAAVPALMNALADEDYVVRRNAALALGQIGEPAKAAATGLIQTLSDEHKDVRQATAWALGNIGKPAEAAVPALISALSDEDKTVRQVVAWALGRIGEPAQAAVPALISALSDEDDLVRRYAARALNSVGIPEPMNTVYERKDKANTKLIAGVLIAFGLLHLLLFLLYPKSAGNLYYAILVGTMAAVSLISGVSGASTALERLRSILIFAFFVLLLRFLYSLFYARLPRKFFLFLVGWIVLSLWYAFIPLSYESLLKALFMVILPLLSFFVGSLTEMFRVLIGAIRQKRDGAWIIGSGFTIFTLAFIANIVAELLDFYYEVFDSVSVFAVLGLLVSMSIHLARNFAKMNKVLEMQNQQISMLNEQLEDELQDAHDVQMSLMPDTAPLIEGLEIAGKCLPANTVSGDFFGYLTGQKDNEIGLVVADVTGKAMKGAMNAMMTDGILRAKAEEMESFSPGHLMTKINSILEARTERLMNVTMVIGMIDTSSQTLTLANAGHHALPILWRQGNIQELMVTGFFPLGSLADIEYSEEQFQLQSGDVLILMTDGIIEVQDNEENYYSDSERLEKIISQFTPDLPAEAMVEAIINDAINYGGDKEQRDDDMTVVIAKIR